MLVTVLLVIAVVGMLLVVILLSTCVFLKSKRRTEHLDTAQHGLYRRCLHVLPKM